LLIYVRFTYPMKINQAAFDQSTEVMSFFIRSY